MFSLVVGVGVVVLVPLSVVVVLPLLVVEVPVPEELEELELLDEELEELVVGQLLYAAAP